MYPTGSVGDPFVVKQNIKDEDLKEGEVICSKCKGKGFLKADDCGDITLYGQMCPKCLGAGKLDWIENVVGKKPSYHGTSCSGSWSSNTTVPISTGNHGSVEKVKLNKVREKMYKYIQESIDRNTNRLFQSLKKKAYKGV